MTLIEVAVIVLIIAIMLAIAIPTYKGARRRAEERNRPTPITTTIPEADPERFEQRRVGDMVCVWDIERDEAQACTLPTTHPESTP